MSDADDPAAVIYEVTATTRRDLAPAFEEYLRESHVAEVVATGCFSSATLAGGGGCYRVQYLAPSAAALERYHREHAPRLRAETLARFPDGVAIEREEWRVLGQYAVG